MDHLVESLFHWEGGSTQERFLREGSAPWSSPLSFCIPFNYDRKSTPITYLVWNFAYIFNCCSDPMSFKLWINHKTRIFFYFFKAIKCICSPFGPFLQTEMIDFPTFPYTSASKSPPFYIAEGQIRYSFWAEPPRIGHCGEYPPPQPPGYLSRIFPPLNLDKSLNIHKETVSYRTLIAPIKVCQLPSYRTSKISFEWIIYRFSQG